MRTFFTAIAVLSWLCCSPAASAMPHGFPPLLEDVEMRDLVSQVAALGLLHDLALSPEQREQIKQVLTPVRAECEAMQKAERKFRDEQLKPRFKRVIADLKAGRDPAPPAEPKGIEGETLRSRMAAMRVKSDRAYEQIAALLSAPQQEKLRDFDLARYLGTPPGLHPRGLICRDPAGLIQEIRGSTQEDLDLIVQRLSRRAEARRGSGPAGEPDPAREEKIRMFIELVKKIHAMPQAEFDARAEALQQELAELAPASARRGKCDRGERPGPRGGSSSKGGFEVKRILLSESFYDSL